MTHSKEIRRQKNRESALRSRLKKDSLLYQLGNCADTYSIRIRQIQNENWAILNSSFPNVSALNVAQLFPKTFGNLDCRGSESLNEKSFSEPTVFLLPF